MAQTNQPMGSSPLAQQGQVWRGPPPGQAIPQGPMSLGGAIGPYQPPTAMTQGPASLGTALGTPSPGSSTGVARTPYNAQLMDQLSAMGGGQGPQARLGGPLGQRPMQAAAGAPQDIQAQLLGGGGGGPPKPMMPGGGGTLSTLRPPMGAPGAGPGGGKGAGGAPGMTPQMKQQVGQLPGGPPPGAPRQGAAGKGAATPQQQQMKQQIARLPR